MTKNAEILKWVEKKIVLDRFEILDNKNVGENQTTSEEIGRVPLVYIRSFSISYTKLLEVSMECSSFLPTITVTFNDSDNAFKMLDFPLDQDLISVFIKPKSTKQQPMRCDFWINRMFGSDIITISGILRVPNMFDDSTFSFYGSSIESVFKSSRKLGLAFASNFESSNDMQYWNSYNYNFIKYIDSIKKYSYVDENSWITSFIDFFYCLNWLNSELSYALNTELELGMITAFNDINKIDKFEAVGSFFLTNHPNFQESDYGVKIEPTLLQENNFDMGHTMTGVSVDMSKSVVNAQNFFVNNYEHEIYKNLNGRDVNDVLVSKQKWLGIQSSNVHPNFIKSKGQNMMNQRTFPGLTVTSDGINMEIMRGRRIPMFIVDLNTVETDMANDTPYSSQQERPNMSEFWSGFYVTSDVKFIWSQNGWKTIAYMSRRQWDVKARKNNFGSK